MTLPAELINQLQAGQELVFSLSVGRRWLTCVRCHLLGPTLARALGSAGALTVTVRTEEPSQVPPDRWEP